MANSFDTILTDALIESISLTVSKGNYVKTAVQLHGLHEDTYYTWIQQAEDDRNAGIPTEQSIYLRLYESMQKAEAESEAKFADVVREAAVEKREWLPAMTFMERRWRDRWGRPAPVQPTIQDNRQVNITHVTVVKDYGEAQRQVEGRDLLDEGQDSPDNRE